MGKTMKFFKTLFVVLTASFITFTIQSAELNIATLDPQAALFSTNVAKKELEELKEKFKELKSLVYQYKDNKENEIKNLSSTQEELENDIENYKISYENLIDKVTLEIEDFVKKNSTNTSVS